MQLHRHAFYTGKKRHRHAIQHTCFIITRSVRLVIYRMSQLISLSDVNTYKGIGKIKCRLQRHCLSHPDESAHFVFKNPKEAE